MEFRRILKDVTQDHGMLIIDQMEAHYTPEEMFFQHKADPNPPPFRVGGFQFWKQSGNVWQQQLKIYKNVTDHHDMKKKDWTPLAEKRNQEEETKFKEEEREEADLLQSNNWNFASPQQRDVIQKSLNKKHAKESHVSQAKKRMDHIIRYIPGPNAMNDSK
jgi:hypothetical protein